MKLPFREERAQLPLMWTKHTARFVADCASALQLGWKVRNVVFAVVTSQQDDAEDLLRDLIRGLE